MPGALIKDGSDKALQKAIYAHAADATLVRLLVPLASGTTPAVAATALLNNSKVSSEKAGDHALRESRHGASVHAGAAGSRPHQDRARTTPYRLRPRTRFHPSAASASSAPPPLAHQKFTASVNSSPRAWCHQKRGI